MQEPQETQVRSLGWEDPLKEGMALHSSILAWRIAWTGALQAPSHLVKDGKGQTKGHEGFPRGSAVESACNVGDAGSIPGLGRSPGGGHSNALQYSCLESPMDRGAWRAAAHWVAKSQTRLK